MDINDEEQIQQFSEPPKIVKASDIRICIVEQDAINDGVFHTFIYAYPYKLESGGMVRVINTSTSNPVRSMLCLSKVLLWLCFDRVIKHAKKLNPNLRIIYSGPILRDDYYGTRRFK